MLKMLKKRDLLLCVPVAMYLILSTPMWLMTSQESEAQTSANQTTQNQTAQQTSANQTMLNQTVLERGNVTVGDLNVVRENLNAARNSVHDNNNQSAFFSLSDVNNQLFRIVRLAGPEGAAVMIELQPVQDSIDSAQDALRDKDIHKALQALNSADLELLSLNRQVSTGEEPPEEEPPEEGGD